MLVGESSFQIEGREKGEERVDEGEWTPHVMGIQGKAVENKLNYIYWLRRRKKGETLNLENKNISPSLRNYQRG